MDGKGLDKAFAFAGYIVIFVFGTIIGWVTYGLYKLVMWLVGLF
jgi:hypothetical protein